MRNNEVGFLLLIMAAVAAVYVLDVVCSELKRYRSLIPEKRRITKEDAVALLVWLSACVCVIWGLAAGGLQLMGIEI